jgi:class 3 adenylate cyclase
MWKGLSNTEWLNRAMGNSALEVTAFSSRESSARFSIKTKLGGFHVEWTERPYEFEFMKWLKVRRDMKSGPVDRLDMLYETFPEGARSKIKLTLHLWPTSALMVPLIRVSATATLKRLVTAVEMLDGELRRSGALPSLPPSASVHAERLARAVSHLTTSGFGALAVRLAEVVATGADDQVMRLRPYELAKTWNVDRREVLATCLAAVQSGMLELRWEVVCPSCRAGSEAVDSLSELRDHGSCQLCDIRYGLNLDEAVEATFRPVSSVRFVEVGPFCAGSPARMPHVVSQAILPSGGKATLGVPSEEGLFRLFLRGGMTAQVEAREGAARAVQVVDDAAVWPAKVTVAPNGTITVVSQDAQERHVKLERSEWQHLAATARDVTMLPLFRKTFSAQVLRGGLSLSVKRLALVFSDLVGSTDLYAHAGDAAAFRFVQDHFEVLTAAVERHHGTVVKTMGDAVMAVFADEIEAIAGAKDMLSDFDRFRVADPLGSRTSLKLGLYGGPGFAATANKVLDYFGQTVNMAARLQGEAGPGQLVAGQALVDDSIARGLIDQAQVLERYQARLKGIETPLLVARVQLGADRKASRAANEGVDTLSSPQSISN